MTEKRKRQSFIQGATILTVSALIVKIIGAVFKIPLVDILGGDGMGYFMTSYDLYMPIYVLASAGLPVAIAKIVAESSAEGRYRDIRKTLKISNLIFLTTGVLGFLILFFGANFFVSTIGNQGAYQAVRAMAPTIFFVCIASSYKGYYQGLQNMYPTALSQVAEQVMKLVAGLSLATYVYKAGLDSFIKTETVFGFAVEHSPDAALLILQFAAAAAILGVGIGALFGLVAIYLRHKISGDNITREELTAPQENTRARVILKRIIAVAIPITLGSCVGQLTGIIDLWSVMNRLHHAVARDYSVIANMYGGAIPFGKALADIPNYLNGSYKGLAVTMYNLIPTFTVAFGVSALPPLTIAWTERNLGALERNITSVLRLTMLVVLPAGIGLAVLSKPILTLIFSSRPMEVAIAAPLLTMLGVAVIFAAACSPINSMLQAIGRPDLPVKIMAVCAVLKLAINYVLVGMPVFNIRGAAIGTVICYVAIMSASLFYLFKITNVKIRFSAIFIKPLICAALCGGSAWFSMMLLERVMAYKLAAILSMAVGGGVYLIALFITRTIDEEDIRRIPKGDKILKIYSKIMRSKT